MQGDWGAAFDRPMLRERQEDFRADGLAAMVLMGSNRAEGAARPTLEVVTRPFRDTSVERFHSKDYTLFLAVHLYLECYEPGADEVLL